MPPDSKDGSGGAHLPWEDRFFDTYPSQIQEIKMGKSFFGSKTVWMNIALGILGVVATNVPALSFLNDPALLTGITAVANVILRLFTKEPITSIVPK